MVTTKFTAALWLSLSVLLLAGCGGAPSAEVPDGNNEDIVALPGEQDVGREDDSSGAEGVPDAPPATVGSQTQPSTTHVGPKAGGALAAAPIQELASVDVGDVADMLYQHGIMWEDGSHHAPHWVSCWPNGSVSAENASDSFLCHVQVSGIAPYEVRVFGSEEDLSVEWSGYLQ